MFKGCECLCDPLHQVLFGWCSVCMLICTKPIQMVYIYVCICMSELCISAMVLFLPALLLTLPVLCAVGRLCDGPSSPCRPQATSCWAPPATLSSCWRKRSVPRRGWRCRRRAGCGSSRACCWGRAPTDDDDDALKSQADMPSPPWLGHSVDFTHWTDPVRFVIPLKRHLFFFFSFFLLLQFVLNIVVDKLFYECTFFFFTSVCNLFPWKRNK